MAFLDVFILSLLRTFWSPSKSAPFLSINFSKKRLKKIIYLTTKNTADSPFPLWVILYPPNSPSEIRPRISGIYMVYCCQIFSYVLEVLEKQHRSSIHPNSICLHLSDGLWRASGCSQAHSSHRISERVSVLAWQPCTAVTKQEDLLLYLTICYSLTEHDTSGTRNHQLDIKEKNSNLFCIGSVYPVHI